MATAVEVPTITGPVVTMDEKGHGALWKGVGATVAWCWIGGKSWIKVTDFAVPINPPFGFWRGGDGKESGKK